MIVGITGVMGSGKSTVTAIFQSEGYAVVDADKISRNIMDPQSEVYKNVLDEFGTSVLNSEKRIDRLKLSELVFNNPIKLTKLNEITHKAILKKVTLEIDDLKRRGENYIAYDCPLPVKHGFMDVVDVIVVVIAPMERRISFIKKRNPNLSIEQIKSRIKNQMSDDEYKNIADYVIENTGSKEELEEKTKKIINNLKIVSK